MIFFSLHPAYPWHSAFTMPGKMHTAPLAPANFFTWKAAHPEAIKKAAFPPEGGPAAHALYDYFFSEASNSSMLVPFSFSADSSSWYC